MRLMPNRSTKPRRRHPRVAALALAGVALIATAIAVASRPPSATIDSSSQLERRLPLPEPQPPGPEPQPLPKTTPPPKPRVWSQMPPPRRLSIPAIGVRARIIPLGLKPDGTSETPSNATDTGWFAPGPEPGEKGAAVVMGHVDSYTGPGVFFRLRALRRGDRIAIALADRRTLRFVVTGAKQTPKSNFPKKLVFARTDRPTLRLVTCGGAFDRTTGHYVDNYIVFARLIET